jgi:hypothetical protein
MDHFADLTRADLSKSPFSQGPVDAKSMLVNWTAFNVFPLKIATKINRIGELKKTINFWL